MIQQPHVPFSVLMPANDVLIHAKERLHNVDLSCSVLMFMAEEGALMELLNFVYRNSLTVTTAPALLDVFMAADKFEVVSCIRYCSRLLRNMPMTPDSALLYLELSSSVLRAEAVEPLTDAAKQFLASSFVKL
ncbi:Uncharacterized protein Rs2_18807 [Raphanus sativus]|nr:Uncharacterized protein Rs2_18807 [Raphanus sativus]